MKRICLVISYFGKWPNWLPFFLKSCEFNPTINWLIFTDCGKPHHCPKNVKIIDFKLKDFNELASKKLKIKINIERVYKICDLKPAFGIIFEDYLKKFDFWGNTDLDLVYGDIRNFITPEILRDYELISARKEYLAGHFTLYKNTKKMKELFMLNKNYKKILLSKDYMGFDEASLLNRELVKNVSLTESELKEENMTMLVKKLLNEKKIKAYLKTIFEEYHKSIHEEGKSPLEKFIFNFDEGILLDQCNKECFYVHFLSSETKRKFIIPQKIRIKNKFYITDYGIFYNLDGKIHKKRKFIRFLDANVTKIKMYIRQKAKIIKKYFPKFYKSIKKRMQK